MQFEDIQAEIYGTIGTGRSNPSYQQTVVRKARLKNTIEFVAAKSVDISRKMEVCNYVDIAHDLKHPNIVKLGRWYQTDHHFLFLLEYCPGGTLLKLLEQDKVLPEPIIRLFAGDILAALLYLHKRGVIFRDLQPRNVLLDECGNLKLSDFSHSERVADQRELVLDPDMIEYMAPELFHAQGVASYASDLWAFGCLLYRMAAGVTPFQGSAQEETVKKIHNFQPAALPNYSAEFNDLLQQLLVKNCFDRITWDKVVAHPFWRDSLGKRLDKTFEGFDISSLPKQPRFDSNKYYTSMAEKKSTILLPSGVKKGVVFVMKPNDISIESLITTSSLLEAPPLIFNPSIETINLPAFNASDSPIEATQLCAVDPQERQKAIGLALDKLRSKQKAKMKFPFISFLISAVSQNIDTANSLANSQFFQDVLDMAKKTTNLSLASGYLLLVALIGRNATEIAEVNLSESVLSPLIELSKKDEKVSRKVIIAVGEIVFYIASRQSMGFPSFTKDIIMQNLTKQDETSRHYAIRAIANLLTTPRYSEVFDIDELEQTVLNFELGKAPLILDSYATCLVMIYKHKKPSQPDKIESLVRKLFLANGSTTRTIGVILATVCNLLQKVRPELEQFIQDSIGELRVKSWLTMCIIFNDDLDGFSSISQKFFSVFDKTATDSSESASVVAKWTASMANKIMVEVQKRNDFTLCQIILQAMSYKLCQREIWTKKFEAEFRTVLKQADFSRPGSENLLEIVRTCVSNGCDPMIVTDLVRAFDSSNDSRYSALKLVSDVLGRHQPPQQLIDFCNSYFPPRMTDLMTGNTVIGDVVLRILSSVANADRSIILKITDKEKLNLIFARVVDNASAATLTAHIIHDNQILIDDLVEAGLINAIKRAVENENSAAFPLLCSILEAISAAIQNNTKQVNLAAIVKAVSPLASLAPRCAELIPEADGKADPDSSRAQRALCLFIYIFSSGNDKEPIPYAGCFEILARKLTACKSDAQVKLLEPVVGMLKWAAEENKQAAAAMKACRPFVEAVGHAADLMESARSLYAEIK